MEARQDFRQPQKEIVMDLNQPLKNVSGCLDFPPVELLFDTEEKKKNA